MSNMGSIPKNKHVFICGATGTGKSYLTERYLAGYEYVVKLDTKDETDERYIEGLSPWYGLEEGKDFTVIRALDELDDVETKKIIYVPPYEEQTESNFSAFFNWCFERGNTIIWIDELMSVGSSYKCPAGLGRVYTQGRSKGVVCWACSQRPSGVPVIATANSHYFFVFNIYLSQDRKRLIESTGMPELDELPGGYNFWFYEMGKEHPVRAVLE